MKSTLMLTLIAAVAAGAAPALAQTADPTWSLSGTAGVVSDYRYRGYSLSNEDPALQGGLTLSHASGVYGDVYVSTIDEYGVGDDGDGAEVETTFTLGWATEAVGFTFDVAVSAYAYPDGTDVSYYEIPVQVGRAVGPLDLTLGAAWAPGGQTALGDEDNRYLWAGAELSPDGWAASLRGTVGFEDGAYAPDGKTDWLLGLAVPLGPVVLGIDYVDSDVDEAAWVGSLFVSF